MNEIVCKNIYKGFRKKKVFEDFSMTLQAGKIYGLLGRNGVGKTTLFNLLSARYLPEQGEILIEGEPVYENESRLQKICYMADWVSGFEETKLKEIFRRAEIAYPNWNQEYADKLMEQFGLEPGMFYGRISKGQTTAAGLIVGLASGCEYVLFDEIYSGLDAVARKQFYQVLMENYEESGRTFVISTHLIEEMDHIFTDVVILKNSRIVLQEEYAELMEQTFYVTGRQETIAELIEDRYPEKVLSTEQIGKLTRVLVYGKWTEQEQKEWIAQGFTIGRASLQDLFVGLVS